VTTAVEAAALVTSLSVARVTSLSVQSSPNPALTTDAVIVSGLLKAGDQPLSGQTAPIQYSTNQKKWVTIGAAITGSDGGFSASWAPPSEGTFYLRATFSRTKQYGASTSNVIVQVVSPAANPPSLSFVSTRGTQIVSADGEALLLRGTNFPGYEYGDWAHTEADYQRIATQGFNVVRLPMAWAMLEPQPGTFDAAYLTTHVDRDIQWAKKYGLYVILDMHQWYWSNRFNDGYGNGMPSWTVAQYPSTPDGMKAAVANFWVNETLQNRLVEIWSKIAKIYAGEPAIAGYDLLNEPPVYVSVAPDLSASNVYAFYLKVIQSVRQVDQNHMILLEPCWGADSCHTPPSAFPVKDNIVWAPHFYPLSWASSYSPSDITILEKELAEDYDRFVVQIGTPMWIGESGAFMDQTSNDYWLHDATALFNKYQLGWALWPPENSVQAIPSSLSPAYP